MLSVGEVSAVYMVSHMDLEGGCNEVPASMRIEPKMFEKPNAKAPTSMPSMDTKLLASMTPLTTISGLEVYNVKRKN